MTPTADMELFAIHQMPLNLFIGQFGDTCRKKGEMRNYIPEM